MKTNVIEYLIESAKNYKNKIAFDDLINNVTFGDLDKITMRVATGLKGFKNKPIAIYIDKCLDAIIAMFSVIRSGNFYTIIDTKMPEDRIKLIFDTLNPALVITTLELEEKAKNIHENVLILENLKETVVDNEYLNDVLSKSIDLDPVYTLFTSGSTGVPKGYIVNHRGVIDFVEAMTKTFNLSSEDVFANQSPLYFDLSINDVFGTIKNGNTIYLIPQSKFMFPAPLVDLLNEKHVDSIFWVPSALVLTSAALSIKAPKYLKRVLFCGEVMPNKQLNIWRKYVPDALYANLYGPAETVDASTYYIVNREFKDEDSLPIGVPFKNTKVLVITEDNKEVNDIDEVGELCILGSSLSMGYYNNKEMTDKAYVQNPLNKNYIEYMYRTGDLVKYNKYGELEFVSRKDYQIKHMGYRIELGEIESQTLSIDDITVSVCIYDDKNKQIVLFYEGKIIDSNELFSLLKEKLPVYMMPSKIFYVKNLPHNANGKVDKKVIKEKYMKGEEL